MPVLLIMSFTSCSNTSTRSVPDCQETVDREIDFMRPYISRGGFPGITSEEQLRESRMDKCMRPDSWYDQECRACILALPPPGYKAFECTVEALERRKAKSS